MPKQDPDWRFALGARPVVRGLVVRLTAEAGIQGHGFASEIPHLGHRYEDVEAALLRMVRALPGADARERGPFLEAFTGAPNPARAAIEMALYDLAARAGGLPLHVLLGGAYRRSYPVLRILALKEPEQVAASARRLLEAGYRHLKIKLDNHDPGLDAARVAAVRAAVGADVHLTLDANQSYSPDEAVAFYEQVRQYRIDIFEQPVPADDLDGLRHVTRSIDCLTEADETAATLHDVFRIAELGAASSVSLKVPKLGGLDSVRTAAAICSAAGIRVRMGAHVGGRLLSAAALHVAAATQAIGEPCELGEFERLLNDTFTGLEVEAGSITVADGPGLGVSPAQPAAIPSAST